MKRTLTTFFILLTACFNAQVWKWAHNYGKVYQEETGATISTDKDFNIYVTGVMQRNNCQNCNTNYSYAAFWKFDKEGNMLWQDTISGALGAKTTEDGYTYMVDGKNVLKYDPNGNVVWSKVCDMQFNSSIALHPLGGVIVSGSIADRGRLARYDENGNKLWQIGNDSTFGSGHTGRSLVCNKKGEIFYSEGYEYATDRYYVMRFDKNGHLLSRTRVAYWVQNLAIDSKDNIFIVYRGYQFLTKYSLGGDSLWTKLYHGGWWPGIQDIAIDTQDNILVAGYYNIDLMINYQMIVNTGQLETFVMKWDTDGNMLWITNSLMAANRPTLMQPNAMDVRDKQILIAGCINGTENFGSQTVATPQSDFTDILLVCLNDIPAVGIPEQSIQGGGFLIFPNPTGGILSVQISNEQASKGKITVINSAGQKVLEDLLNDGNTTYTLNLTGLKRGTYMIRVSSSEGIETKKIIVE